MSVSQRWMLAFAEWVRETIRERSIAGQHRGREAGKARPARSPDGVSQGSHTAVAPTGSFRHDACQGLPRCAFYYKAIAGI